MYIKFSEYLKLRIFPSFLFQKKKKIYVSYTGNRIIINPIASTLAIMYFFKMLAKITK